MHYRKCKHQLNRLDCPKILLAQYVLEKLDHVLVEEIFLITDGLDYRVELVFLAQLLNLDVSLIKINDQHMQVSENIVYDISNGCLH